MSRTFYPVDAYASHTPDYQLLPFRFLRLDERNELLVNEAGEFLISPTGTTRALVRRQLAPGSDLYSTLKAKQFLTDSNSSHLLDILASKYRTKHAFMEGFTKLHIFVVTLRCDHSCHYCQVSRQTEDKENYDMSFDTAARSIELMMKSPSHNVTLEMQGGEPLLAFDVIRFIVPRAKKRAMELGKTLDLVVTTNLANATDEMLFYLRDENVKISTSLDGPAFIHNTNRPRPGNNSYELTIRNIERARQIVGWSNVSALMTTTQLSLQHPTEIIDEYVAQGFHSIFLRPISPYGFALKTKRKTGYHVSEFLEFYRKGLEHIIQLNRNGYDLAEVYAKIILTKMLTPYGTGFVDLQSPAGAGVSVLVYNYDGDIYATDESRMLAEMGDHTFRLGNVRTDTHKDIFTGDAFLNLAAAACNQALPGCSDCALQTFCGADPVFHHATQGNVIGHRPTSEFCERNTEVMKHLLGLVSAGDRELMRIFMAWIQNARVTEISEMAPS
ncbi:MAG TPA: His-Xaa-Ser system radical SAM maturase HxsB [Terriglobales bacterium]|nr:His-Xaa-Ser system radical SAM maturase HxsB [Terriglobales bacterium]